ncbi:MAG: DR2241 family protein [Chthoniobacterales bacterium]
MNDAAGSIPRVNFFAERLSTLPGRIGQILISAADGGGFDLRHREDATRLDLGTANESGAAAEIARFDDAGKFRPLKTAPNLRHGWRLLLADAGAVRHAVDLFYPGRLAVWQAQVNGALTTTSLRETLSRQTGIYRAAAKITDTAADVLVAGFCRSEQGCLRTILWRRDETQATASTRLPRSKFDPEFDQTGRGEETIPLLCQEACNLLVAEARQTVKNADG